MDPYRNKGETPPPPPPAFQPLEVAVRDLQVLPKAMWNVGCDSCGRRISRWRARMSKRDFQLQSVCSACFLYKSDWGKANQVEMKKFIREVEKEMGRRLEVDSKDKLIGRDADRILYSIAQTSRIFKLASKQDD